MMISCRSEMKTLDGISFKFISHIISNTLNNLKYLSTSRRVQQLHQFLGHVSFPPTTIPSVHFLAHGTPTNVSYSRSGVLFGRRAVAVCKVGVVSSQPVVRVGCVVGAVTSTCNEQLVKRYRVMRQLLVTWKDRSYWHVLTIFWSYALMGIEMLKDITTVISVLSEI